MSCSAANGTNPARTTPTAEVSTNDGRGWANPRGRYRCYAFKRVKKCKSLDFASRNEDRIATETVPMLAPTDLVQLPKGQTFALLHGGQLHKIRIPLPAALSPYPTRMDSKIAREQRQLVVR